MFSTKRSGWYYLRAVAPIQVGSSGVLYFKQKIHSSHTDFNKIAQKYFIDGYLKHETLIPLGERGQFKEFTGGINPPKFEAVSTPATPEPVVVEVPAVVEEPFLADPVNDESFGPEIVVEAVEAVVIEVPTIEEEIEEEDIPEVSENTESENIATPKKRTNKKKK